MSIVLLVIALSFGGLIVVFLAMVTAMRYGETIISVLERIVGKQSTPFQKLRILGLSVAIALVIVGVMVFLGH